MSMFGGASGGSNQKLKFPSAESLQSKYAVPLDEAAYASAFNPPGGRGLWGEVPELVPGLKTMINQAGTEVSRGTSDATLGELEKTGLASAASKLRSDDPTGTSLDLGQPILAAEKRGRNYFENLFSLGETKTPKIGFSGQDAVNLALAKIGFQNNYNQTLFGNAQSAAYAQAQQQAQLLSGVGAAVTGGINYAQNQSPATPTADPYADPFSKIYDPTAPFYGSPSA